MQNYVLMEYALCVLGRDVEGGGLHRAYIKIKVM